MEELEQEKLKGVPVDTAKEITKLQEKLVRQQRGFRQCSLHLYTHNCATILGSLFVWHGVKKDDKTQCNFEFLQIRILNFNIGGCAKILVTWL